MKTYPIKEIFRSIQGEGPSVGSEAIFIRFAGCNLYCAFCDESTHIGPELEADEIIEGVEAHLGMEEKQDGLRIVFTGGEPLLWLDQSLLMIFKRAGYTICIETNGAANTAESMPLPMTSLLLVDELIVSPKDVEPSFSIIHAATAIKYLVNDNGCMIGQRWMKEVVKQAGMYRGQKAALILQPITPRDMGKLEASVKTDTRPFYKSCKAAMEIARSKRPEYWRVIPQVHVFMGLK